MKSNVKWFLVQRFLITMFCVYLGVEAINFIYRVALTPAVIVFLETQQIEITGNSNVAVWLLQMLFFSRQIFCRPASESGYRRSLGG